MIRIILNAHPGLARQFLPRLFLASFLLMAFAPSALAATPNKTVLVVVDLSNSTKTHRADYVKYFRMILDAMGEGDLLLVTKITKHPSAGESLAFPAVKYEESSLMSSRQRLKEMNLKRSLDALKNFEALVREEVDETPIIEVTRNSQRLMQQFKAERQIIVYLSDMMEYSKSTANFESTKPVLSQKLAEGALTKIIKEGRLAALKGVKIYVAGARDADAARKDTVRWFWKEYFRLAEAKLNPNDYGPDLVAFDECTPPDLAVQFLKMSATKS